MEEYETKKGDSKTAEFEREFRNKTAGYIMASLGLVAGLAWNEAISALISYLFPIGRNTLFAKFTYAVLITLTVSILGAYLLRILNSDEKK